MIGTITAFLIEKSIEIGLSAVFVIGVGVYGYWKAYHKINEDKLVFYDITDRIVKSKKIQ